MVEIDDKFKEAMLNRDEKLEKFHKHGITDDFLIGKLRDELGAEQDNKKLWKIQQNARKDAHKLRGDYPAEQHEHTGDVIFHSNVPEPDMPEREEKKEEIPPLPDQAPKEEKKPSYQPTEEAPSYVTESKN